VVAAVAALTTSLPAAYRTPLHRERMIFSGDRGHVHASSIVETPNGSMLAVWYENGPKNPAYYFQGGDEDKSDDVRIAGARLPPNGAAWDAPFVISDTFGVSDNNPALGIDGQKRLWLVHATLLAVPARTWGSAILQYKVATDYEGSGPPRWDHSSVLVPKPDGFDEAVAGAADDVRRRSGRQSPQGLERARAMLDRLDDPFARRLGWMPRVHPVALKDGSFVVPLANENFNLAAMAITRDGGENWTFSRPVPGLGVTQPSVVQFRDGRLSAFFRDATSAHRIHRAESTDGGLTWSPVTATTLPNPGGGIEAIALASGELAIIYNDKESSPRDRLAVSISADQGQTWPWTRHLENTPGQRFDYPSIVQAKDGSLHATYSYNLKTIKHVMFNEAWVKEAQTSPPASPVTSATHVLVSRAPGRYGGWPANHGIWKWGDEILVGFSWGHMTDGGAERGHPIDRQRPEEHMLARSLDGGDTWTLEKPTGLTPPPDPGNIAGVPTERGKPVSDLTTPIDFTAPGFALTARMSNIHVGPSWFFYSTDKGKAWNGPFSLPDFGHKGIAARTDYLVEGPRQLTMFLTAAKSNGREGRVICVRTTDGGRTWTQVGLVGPEPEGNDFAIMPSSLRLSPTSILTLVRHRQWIEAYRSDDNGANWTHVVRAVPDTGRGNPPSLVKLQDGRLLVTFGYRAEPFGIRARTSTDQGRTWSSDLVVRPGAVDWDLGYTRSVQRADGKIVTVYYYNDATSPERYIGATIWTP
jgi:predicted neuraminidase